MNWVRIRCALSALVLVLMAGAARGGVLYWMIDGDASASFQIAYAQTLQKAKKQGGNADSVVARAYAVDKKSTGTRKTYEFVGVAAVDDAGTSFKGWSIPETLPSTIEPDNLIFGVEMGFMDGDNNFTATYWAWDAQGLTYAQLNEMGAIQSGPTAIYDGPVNAAKAPWTNNPHSVPEPTGGLLVVLGGAVLLLRRNGHA